MEEHRKKMVEEAGLTDKDVSDVTYAVETAESFIQCHDSGNSHLDSNLKNVFTHLASALLRVGIQNALLRKRLDKLEGNQETGDGAYGGG